MFDNATQEFILLQKYEYTCEGLATRSNAFLNATLAVAPEKRAKWVAKDSFHDYSHPE
jgi:hypothetical protein